MAGSVRSTGYLKLSPYFLIDGGLGFEGETAEAVIRFLESLDPLLPVHKVHKAGGEVGLWRAR